MAESLCAQVNSKVFIVQSLLAWYIYLLRSKIANFLAECIIQTKRVLVRKVSRKEYGGMTIPDYCLKILFNFDLIKTGSLVLVEHLRIQVQMSLKRKTQLWIFSRILLLKGVALKSLGVIRYFFIKITLLKYGFDLIERKGTHK